MNTCTTWLAALLSFTHQQKQSIHQICQCQRSTTSHLKLPKAHRTGLFSANPYVNLKDLMVNWWFGILEVPLSSNPFHKGILGIQTANPKHQSAICGLKELMNSENTTMFFACLSQLRPTGSRVCEKMCFCCEIPRKQFKGEGENKQF